MPLGALATFAGDPLSFAAEATLLARASAVLRDDDAHLLDLVSAVLLQQLAAEGSIRLVVTIRTGEPAPDADPPECGHVVGTTRRVGRLGWPPPTGPSSSDFWQQAWGGTAECRE